MALSTHCVFHRGSGPVVAAAIHNGHDTRKSVEKHLAIDERQQLREEDPVTGEWTQVANTQIVGLRSRFQVDLNRPRKHTVYETSADAWGTEVWEEPPDRKMIDAVIRDGYGIAQEYLPAAKNGDVRLFVMNGRPLMKDGKYAAFRRVKKTVDMRSKMHSGGETDPRSAMCRSQPCDGRSPVHSTTGSVLSDSVALSQKITPSFSRRQRTSERKTART